MSDPNIYPLFIGGPLAGQQLKVPKAQFSYLHINDQKELPLAVEATKPEFGYIRFDVQIEGGILHYFRPENWTPDQVMQELVLMYRAGAQASGAEKAAR